MNCSCNPCGRCRFFRRIGKYASLISGWAMAVFALRQLGMSSDEASLAVLMSGIGLFVAYLAYRAARDSGMVGYFLAWGVTRATERAERERPESPRD